MVLMVIYYLFGVDATRFTWSSESHFGWREVLHQQWSDKSVHISHVAYKVTNVMASSSTLLPGATVYATREWDFNFQFPISRFSNYFDLWLLFQSRSQSQSHLRTGGVRGDLDCKVMSSSCVGALISWLCCLDSQFTSWRPATCFPSFLSSIR